jgi:uncharacterized protein
VSKTLPSPEEAIKILRECGCSAHVIRHCKAVAKLAVQIAEKCVNNGTHVDIELAQIGALLHDIGRAKTHGVNHPIVGAEIARSLGLPSSLVSIIERHLGGGISAEEAREFGWPEGTYIPKTLEEKIVTYADKLIEGERRVPIEKTVQKLKNRLGADHPSVRRMLSLHEEMSNLCR